jgi:Protein kinase domain
MDDSFSYNDEDDNDQGGASENSDSEANGIESEEGHCSSNENKNNKNNKNVLSVAGNDAALFAMQNDSEDKQQPHTANGAGAAEQQQQQQQQQEGEQHQQPRTTVVSSSLRTAWRDRLARFNSAWVAMNLKELRDIVSLDLPYMPRELIDGMVAAIDRYNEMLLQQQQDHGGGGAATAMAQQQQELLQQTEPEDPPTTISMTIAGVEGPRNATTLRTTRDDQRQLLAGLDDEQRALAAGLQGENRVLFIHMAKAMAVAKEEAKANARKLAVAEEEAKIAKEEAKIAKEEAKIVKEEAKVNAAITAKLVEEEAKVHAAINKIVDNVNSIDSTFQTLGNLSQEGETLAMGNETNSKAAFAGELMLADNNGTTSGLLGTGGVYSDLLNSAEPFVVEQLGITIDQNTGKWKAPPDNANCYKELQNVAIDWYEIISKSTILKDKPKKKKRKENASNGVLEVSALDYKKHVQDSLEIWKTATSANDFSEQTSYFPGAQSHEIDGVQPVLAYLLERIAKCYDDSTRPALLSPAKNNIGREAMLAPMVTQRTFRKIDTVFSKEGRYHIAMFDRNLQLFVEEKNLCRKTQAMDSLADEAERQTIGSLAKSVYYFFNLLGVGVASWATGLTTNTVYVKLYQLRLSMENQKDSDDESPMAKLSLQRSRPYPLVTKDNFDRIMKSLPLPLSSSNVRSITELKVALYGVDGVDGLDETGIPCGIRLYWQLLNQRRGSLFGPQSDVFDLGVAKFGPIIGSGSSGVVLKCGEDSVVKISTSPSNAHWQNELDTLRRISALPSAALGLPSIVGVVDVPMTLGGINFERKGLILKPLGVPLLVYMKDNKTAASTVGDVVGRDVRDALSFIHSHKIYHNDVSPKNIVVINHTTECTAVIVDFAIASSNGKSLTGVQGTPAYLHQDILKQHVRKQWQPIPEHDMTALWFTIAAIHNGGSPNWSVCVSNDTGEHFEHTMNNRFACAEKLLEGTKWTWHQFKKSWQQKISH